MTPTFRPTWLRTLDPWAWAILIGTVAAVAVAAVTAAGAVRSRARVRQAAMASLANYTAVALEQFVNGYEVQLRQNFVPIIPPPYEIEPLDRQGAQPLADMVYMIDRLQHDPCRCMVSPGPTAIFRLEIGAGRAEAVDSLGVPLPRLDSLVANAVIREIDSLRSLGWRYGFVAAATSSGDQFLFFTHRADSASGRRFAHGLAIPARRMSEAVFGPAFGRLRLIPRHLLGLVSTNGDYLSIELRTADGRILFATEPQYPDGPTESLNLPSLRGGIQVIGRLNPRIKDALIPGGVPPSVPAKELGMIGLSVTLLVAIAWLGLRAAQLARLRSDFASSVTHELRTPVTQIRLAAETMLLGRAKSPDTTRRSLASIVDETSRLQQLIDNVLHFSRAERRLTRVAVEPLSLDGLVGRVAADFAPLVADRGIRLAVTIPADIVVVADPNAVRQILLNLLDNAARYGPEGQQISIGARRRGPLADCWVEDEGPGISVPDALRVWQPFVRLERDRESVVAGTGLGLAVVRELVLAQGGNCRIERGTYRGARIVIQLPIAPRLG